MSATKISSLKKSLASKSFCSLWFLMQSLRHFPDFLFGLLPSFLSNNSSSLDLSHQKQQYRPKFSLKIWKKLVYRDTVAFLCIPFFSCVFSSDEVTKYWAPSSVSASVSARPRVSMNPNIPPMSERKSPKLLSWRMTLVRSKFISMEALTIKSKPRETLDVNRVLLSLTLNRVTLFSSD